MKSEEELKRFIINERMSLQEAMMKQCREDVWFSDLEACIYRTIQWLNNNE